MIFYFLSDHKQVSAANDLEQNHKKSFQTDKFVKGKKKTLCESCKKVDKSTKASSPEINTATKRFIYTRTRANRHKKVKNLLPEDS